MPSGPPLSRLDQLTIGADAQEARRASEWLDTTCRQHGVPQAEVDRLALCLDEALANIIDHGGKTALSEPVRVQLEVGPHESGDMARVTVSDAGMAFDPLTAPTGGPASTLDEAVPGGRGLGIIRHCSFSLDYRREDGRNHLTFGTLWTAVKPPM